MKTKKLAKLPLFVTRGKDRFFVYKNKRYRIDSIKSNDKIIAEMLKIIKILANNEKRSKQRYKSKLVRKKTLKKQKEGSSKNAEDPVISSNPVSQNDFIKYWLQNSSTKIEPVKDSQPVQPVVIDNTDKIIDLVKFTSDESAKNLEQQRRFYEEYARATQDYQNEQYKQYQQEQRRITDYQYEQNAKTQQTQDKLIDKIIKLNRTANLPISYEAFSEEQKNELAEQKKEMDQRLLVFNDAEQNYEKINKELEDLKKEKKKKTTEVISLLADYEKQKNEQKQKIEDMKSEIIEKQKISDNLLKQAQIEYEKKLSDGQIEAEQNATKIIQEAKDESNKLKALELSGIRAEKEKLQGEVINLTFRLKANKIKVKNSLQTQERELKEQAELQARALNEENEAKNKDLQKRLKLKEKLLTEIQNTIDTTTADLNKLEEDIKLKDVELKQVKNEFKKTKHELEINEGLVKSTQATIQKLEIDAANAQIQNVSKNAKYEMELLEKQENAKLVQAATYKAIQDKEAAEKETKKIKEEKEKMEIIAAEAALGESNLIEQAKLLKQKSKKKDYDKIIKDEIDKVRIKIDEEDKIKRDNFREFIIKSSNKKIGGYTMKTFLLSLLTDEQKNDISPMIPLPALYTKYLSLKQNEPDILRNLQEKLIDQMDAVKKNEMKGKTGSKAPKYEVPEDSIIFDKEKKLEIETGKIIKKYDIKNASKIITIDDDELSNDELSKDELKASDFLSDDEEAFHDADETVELANPADPVTFTENIASSSGSGSGSGNMKGGLYNYEINELMKKYKGFLGAYAIDQLNLLKPKSINFSFIMNTKPIKIKHGHWVALFISPDTIEYYDSLAEEPNRRLVQLLKPILNKHGKKGNIWQYKINSVKLQKSTTDTCGYFAMKFITDRYNGKTFKQATRFKTIEDSVKGEKDVNKFKSMIKDFGYVK